MKTILIETVTNGFLVRPFTPCPEWTRGDCGNIFVFTTVEALAAELPKMLAHDEVYTRLTPKIVDPPTCT